MASPVVTANTATVFVNGLIDIQDLFSASDADNDIVSYTFTDFRDLANSGFFLFDGVPIDNGGSITIDAADLDRLQYSGGSQIFFEGFRVSAEDAAGNFSNNAVGRIYSVRSNTTRPNVARPFFDVLANESTPASQFVRGFDPDGYPLTEFEFSDLNNVAMLFTTNTRMWVGSSGHNFETGDTVTIIGADQAQFNVTATITVTNDNVFYIDTPGLVPTSATGDIKVYEHNQGYFELNGSALPQGTTFRVSADELENLHYVATGPDDVENVYVRGYDGASWSIQKKGAATISDNANRPTVQFSRSVTPADQSHDFWESLNVTDADQNTIKTYMFFNTSPHAQNGDMYFQGEVVPRKTWITVQADELNQLSFTTPRQGFEQLIRVRAYDGEHWSIPGTHTIESTPPIIRPSIEPTVNLMIHEQRELVAIDSVFSKSDVGDTHTHVQIFEPTTDPASGNFRFGVTNLEGGVVHEFPIQAFNNGVSFYTGDYQNRHIDPIYQRNWNGTEWSKWQKIEIRTEPEFDNALFSGATWMGILPFADDGRLRVTYSFMQRFPDYGTGEARDGNPLLLEHFERFSTEQRINTRKVFENLENIINVDFVEVPDTSFNSLGYEGGDIRFGEYGIPFPTSTASAFAFYPGFTAEAGDIWINRLNSANGPEPTHDPDTFDYYTLLHEVGHALGLKHSFTDISRLPESTDSADFTVMSYTGSESYDFFNDIGAPATFQPYDIAELQQLYGANTTYRNGDDDYAIGNYFQRQQFVETIWDTGGHDTISGVGSVRPTTIDLRQGARSSVGAFERNLSIAHGVEIEDAIGSDLSDTLIGNYLDNTLIGGLGNDDLTGLQGNDFLIGGAGNDNFNWGVGDGDDTINDQGFGGSDTLIIENLLGADNLTQDLVFEMSGDNLLVTLAIDGGSEEGTVVIQNQTLAGYEIESLTIGGQTIDLVDLTSQLAPGVDTFEATTNASTNGLLVMPV